MERKFVAPGPGSWSLDNTHQNGAVTPYSASCYSHGLPLGFRESCARYGLPLSHLQAGFVRGFMYMQQVPIGGKVESDRLPPKWLFKLVGALHPAFRKRFRDADRSFSSRHWLQDLQDWDQLKEDSIAKNTALQSVETSQLDSSELVAHLDDCYSNHKEMLFRHHTYTVSSLLPIGWFLDTATRHSGLAVEEVTPLLAGSTPVSAGIARDELNALAALLREANISKDKLESLPPAEALSVIRGSGSKVVEALEDYLAIAGYMLIGGYCISEKTLLESPNILVARILDALEPKSEIVANAANKDLENRIRAMISTEFYDEFDSSLADALRISRLRDERGIYNDIWSAGISRAAVLEAGRRLCKEGVLSNPELIMDATHEEMLALLDGDRSLTEQELERRRDWRLNKSIDSMPQQLGTMPVEPPPVDWFPKKAQPTIRAFAIAMENLFYEGSEPVSDKIAGLPVSPGIYEGVAKVINSTREFDRLDQGDVLVTKNTSAGFNVVLPVIGALVTDRGGVLSHAAIVSREYGIPGVVGTKTASKTIRDGDRVRVDGDKGEVTILS
jgi:pyruvate,water dikinase